VTCRGPISWMLPSLRRSLDRSRPPLAVIRTGRFLAVERTHGCKGHSPFRLLLSVRRGRCWCPAGDPVKGPRGGDLRSP
jgi:hypothetical protein